MDKNILVVLICSLVLFLILIVLILHSLYKIKYYEKKMAYSKINKNINIKTHSSKKKIEQFGSLRLLLNRVKYNFTPREFEIFCYYLFIELGYDVELTKYKHDGGKDLILNNSIIVECKKYINKIVGREICQKALGAMLQNHANKTIVITTGKYNLNAKRIERDVDELVLLDFEGILKCLEKIGEEKSMYIFNKVKSYRI